MYKWPLAKNNFTWLDRLKICKFFLNPKNRWTQDKYVREYEKIAAKYVGAEYAVFVSSGSSANQLIALKLKQDLIKTGEWPRKNKVIVSAVTWQTNVSVWSMLGFEPIFVDVNLKDFCVDYYDVAQILDNRNDIACVFPTAVLGHAPNVDILKSWQKKTKVFLDACESSESTIVNIDKWWIDNPCGIFTSTTSCFVAHQWSNGMEGGFIFTNDIREYIYFLQARAHGLNRNLNPYKEYIRQKAKDEPTFNINDLYHRNDLVHFEFDFQVLSSNFRNTEIAAFCGILDSRRWETHKKIRRNLGRSFYDALDKEKYIVTLSQVRDEGHVPFCLPIVCKDPHLIHKVKEILEKFKIEYRPFISGNMLRQIPYQQYGNYKKYPNAELLNNQAVYIGLNYDLTEKQVTALVKVLNVL